MSLRLAFAVAAALGLADSSSAAVKLPALFSDHMVLQRDQPVAVWGQAAPGEKVIVKIRDQEKTTTADQDGAWSLKLDPLKTGGPDKLTVSASNSVTIDDVLVGEVWIGSGQSNMEGTVSGYAKGDEVLAKLATASYPKLRLSRRGGKWMEATGQTIKGFSAILFAFGQKLQQELDVPVGLMVGAVGGTPSGRWLTEEMLKNDTACQELIRKLSAAHDEDADKKKYQAALAKWEKDAEQAKNDGKKAPPKPLPPLKPGQIRGKAGDLYLQNIRPMVPYTIRGVVWDQGESGTAIQGIDQFTLMGSLIKGWRAEFKQPGFAFIYIQKPSGGGCAWDVKNPMTSKGEAFAPQPANVPGFNDGLYRETHVRISSYPHTAMAISSDLGPGVHPSNKSGYGQRATQVALGMVYGKKLEYSGPVYDSHTVEGSKVRLKFTHVGQGLTARHGDRLQGFLIAGEDRVSHWAKAEINDNTVVVSSDKVTKPTAVRYAWSQQHRWANLFNKDGLPAQTFRTDNWVSPTPGK